MSRYLIILSVVAFAATVFFLRKETVSLTDEDDVSQGRGARRAPASIAREVFAFEKSASVKFDFNEEVTTQTFKGFFFLDWEEDKVATASVKVDGHPTDIRIKARFSDRFTLACLSIPKQLTEQESDFVTLLKNLLLDYSFKTNRDDNGEYTARLETMVTASGKKSVKKIKERYIASGTKALSVEASLHKISHDVRLHEARGTEKFRIDFTEDKAAVAETSYILMAQEGSHEQPEVDEDRELGDCTTDLRQEVKVTEKVPGREFREVLAGLAGLDRSKRQGAMRKILKGLRGSPELLGEFMGWLQTIQGDRQLSAFAIGILGTLGTPEAQKELVSLFAGATDKMSYVQYQVMNAFTLTGAPLTGESREFLMGQLGESSSPFAEGAAYALGSSIQNNPESPEARSDLRQLVSGLEEGQSHREKMIYLDAIGNTGSKEAAATLARYAVSPDESLREKAVLGHRAMDPSLSKKIFEAALNDQSPRVRRAALEAMKSSPRPELYGGLVSGCANSSTDAELRAECAKLVPQEDR